MESMAYVDEHRLYKVLGVYLLLKASCDGHFTLHKEQRKAIMNALGIKTIVSFNKHLNRLQSLNWIGVDQNTQTCYIRSFNHLRMRYGWVKRISVVAPIEDMKNVKVFVEASLLSAQVRKMVNGRKAKIKKLIGSSALIKESAIQELVSKGLISAYIGLCTVQIGKLLGVSRSQADRLKKQMQVLGYIRCNAKYKVVHTSTEPDFAIFDYLTPRATYKVKKRKQNGITLYVYLERTYDEIVQCMEFTNQKSIIKRLQYEKNERVD